MHLHIESRHSPAADVAVDRPKHWADERACRDEDPETFFPPGRATHMIARAQRICGRCPVRAECLNEALETEQDFGVWGGLSEFERRRLHGRRPTHPVPTSRAEELLADPAEFLELAGQDLTPVQIAAALRTNVATVNKVRAAVEAKRLSAGGVEGAR